MIKMVTWPSNNIALTQYCGGGFSKALIILFSEVLMHIHVRFFPFKNTKKKKKIQPKNLICLRPQATLGHVCQTQQNNYVYIEASK